MQIDPRWHARFVLALLLLIAAPAAWAERPAAPRMLPEETVLYLRARDMPELIAKFNETGLGKILADEQIKPLVAQLYGTLGEAFAAASADAELGVSLDAILSLPQGETVLALIAPRGERPVLIAWIDVAEQAQAMRKLLERGEQALRDDGAAFSSETIRDVEFRVWDPDGNQRRRILHFEKEGTFVFSSNLDFAKEFLNRWDNVVKAEAAAEGDKQSEPVATLANNPKFTAIMSRCRGGRDEPPQFSWFVDPILLARSATRGNVGAQTGIALLPVIGLDGLKGVGGSMTLATEDFDLINHVHVLTDSPRRGVLKMIAFDTGDTTPEDWVPADSARYLTVHWDVDDTYGELTTLYDSFNGEGELGKRVGGWIDRELGLDFEQDLLGQFGGRVSFCTWYERPIVFASEVTVAAIQVDDPKKFQQVFDRTVARFPERLVKQIHAGQTLYEVKIEGPRRRAAAQQEGQAPPDAPEAENFRLPTPGVMFMGDRVFISNQLSGLHKVIQSSADNDAGLAEELDFKLISSKIRRQQGGSQPGMLLFHRPEEAMRAMYELATSDQTKSRLKTAADGNPFFQGIDKAMQENPLPPFAVIEQYLAPGGGVIVADETGFHYTGFTLRRKQ